MYSHIQTDTTGNFLRYITAGALIEWDANNYCTAFALEKDGKAEQFNVCPLYSAGQPEFDPLTQKCVEADAVLIDGKWTQQWAVVDLTDEEKKSRVPQSVTMRQARLALLAANLLDDVEAAVAAAGRAAQIQWEYATEVQRTHPLIAAVQQAQGLTDAQIDALFVAAAGM